MNNFELVFDDGVWWVYVRSLNDYLVLFARCEEQNEDGALAEVDELNKKTRPGEKSKPTVATNEVDGELKAKIIDLARRG